MNEKQQRVVVCAANRIDCEFGEIICGARHFDQIMRKQIANKIYLNPEKRGADYEQGFIDQWGLFMTRKEALAVAIAANQINMRRPKTSPKDQLFSEDIY